MKKLLYVLGALSLGVIIIIGVSIGITIHKGRSLDSESKMFVDSAIPAIAGPWDKDQLVSRSSPDLLRSTTPEQLASVFTALSKLGSLVKYQGSSGQAVMSYFTGSGSNVTASYVASASFQNGTASFQITLVKRGTWQINYFHVNPQYGNNTLQNM